MKKLLAIVLLTAASAIPAHAKVKAVASITVIADMVKQVGGDAVDVVSMAGPNTDPHTYQPTPDDAKALAQSQVLFLNGLGLEGWLNKVAGSKAYKGLVVTTTQGLKPRQMDEDGKTVTDPHAWQSLGNAPAYVANITAGLCKVEPASCATYKKNAEAYLAEVKALDAEVKAQIATVPPAQRQIVTTHDAFGYFGAAYGVKFMAPEGLHEDAEPTARDLAALIRQIKANHVTALFIENLSNSKVIDAIAHETGVKPGPALYSDALSKPGEGADTYLGLFRHNVPLMVKAMIGK